MRIIDCWVVFCVAVLLNAALIYASPQKGVDECRRSISQSSAQHSSSMFFSGSPWIFTKTMPIASHSQVSFSPLVFQCRELSLGHFFRAVPGRPGPSPGAESPHLLRCRRPPSKVSSVDLDLRSELTADGSSVDCQNFLILERL